MNQRVNWPNDTLIESSKDKNNSNRLSYINISLTDKSPPQTDQHDMLHYVQHVVHKAQCDKLVTDNHRQFITKFTLTIHLS